MAEPEDRRLDAIVQVLIRIQQEQSALAERIARLEAASGGAPPRPAQAPVSPEAQQREPAPAGAAAQNEQAGVRGREAEPAAAAPPHSPADEPTRELETRMGLTWINRIGVVTLVLGIAFFFKYAIDNRWIGEGGRVALGILAGLAMLGAADRLWRRGQRIFAQGITGAGIADLYVSFYAAFGFYQLIMQPAAFGLMVLNTAAAIVLALLYGSQAIAALGLIGGYVTPLLLSTGKDVPWFFLSYVLLLSCAAALLASRRRWRFQDVLAFSAAFILFSAWIGRHFTPEKRIVAVVFTLAYYALFVTRDVRGIAALAPAAACIHLLSISLPAPYPFLLTAPFVIAAAMVIADARNRPEILLSVFIAFWATYGLGHSDFADSPAATNLSVFALAALSFAIFFMWPLWRAVRGAPVERAGLIMMPLNAAFFYAASYALLRSEFEPWLGLFTVVLAGAYFGFARWLWSASPGERLAAALHTGIALVLVTLAIPIQFAGFRITMAWALEGAALSWVAGRARDERLTWLSVVVFGLAFVRLAAFDASLAASALAFNLRFLTFAVAAVSVGLAAYSLREWPGAGALYVSGHGILIWALVLEVLGYAARAAAPENVRNLQSAAVSILLAAYAVLLVAIGVGVKSALNRIFGLLLIATVVVKLYLYDVWRIDRGIYRVAAFAGLGIFLLLMSYLYSRFRTSIEAFWRDGESRS